MDTGRAGAWSGWKGSVGLQRTEVSSPARGSLQQAPRGHDERHCAVVLQGGEREGPGGGGYVRHTETQGTVCQGSYA